MLVQINTGCSECGREVPEIGAGYVDTHGEVWDYEINTSEVWAGSIYVYLTCPECCMQEEESSPSGPVNGTCQ